MEENTGFNEKNFTINQAQVLFDLITNTAKTEGTLVTILGMTNRILAHLENKDREQMWQETIEREKANQDAFIEVLMKRYLGEDFKLSDLPPAQKQK